MRRIESQLESQLARWAPLLLALSTAASLAPFIDKAIHMDDPLFLWSAFHLQGHFSDFYGFDVNWYGETMPLWEIAKNPPGVAYFIAGVGSVLGFGERSLHAAFMLPAVGVILGVYSLARLLTSQPLFAAGIALATPVFLISSTGLMSDTSMLCFWVWSVRFWIGGVESGRSWKLLVAATLIALCAMTKYAGLCLIPLLAAYSLAKRSPRTTVFLLVPIFGMVAYQLATEDLYGRGLLLDAVFYSVEKREFAPAAIAEKLFVGVVFGGGCVATLWVYLPWLGSRRLALAPVGVLLSLFALLPALGSVGELLLRDAEGVRWAAVAHVAIFATAGLCVLGLLLMDVKERGDAASWLLFLWVAGVFLFATLINWTVSGRSLLPAVPAVAISIARRIDARQSSGHPLRCSPLMALAPALVLALAPTWADYRFANVAREAAAKIDSLTRDRDGDLWFQGHWGFQYYLQAAGAKPAELSHAEVAVGDLLVLPSNNSSVFSPDEKYVASALVLEFPSTGWIVTMNRAMRVGFYSDLWGPLPFALGVVEPERYVIVEVRDPDVP